MTSATNIIASLLPAEPSAAIPDKPAASVAGGFEALVAGAPPATAAPVVSSAPKAPGTSLSTAATDIAATAALAAANTAPAPSATGITASTTGATETAAPPSAALAALTGNLFDGYQGTAGATANPSGAAAPSGTIAPSTVSGPATTASPADGLLAPAGQAVISGGELTFSSNTPGTAPPAGFGVAEPSRACSRAAERR